MSISSVSLKLWQALSSVEQERVRALRIDDQQIEYAGTVQRAIDTCTSSSSAEVAGLAVLVDQQVAGFLVLRRGSMLPEWAPSQSVALAGMRMDIAYQGAGLGQKALLLVDQWLLANWPETPVVALTVDEKNLAGRVAYQRVGYTEFAEPQPGRIGTVRYLSKSLQLSPSAEPPRFSRRLQLLRRWSHEEVKQVLT